jgi:hypothetical protein
MDVVIGLVLIERCAGFFFFGLRRMNTTACAPALVCFLAALVDD